MGNRKLSDRNTPPVIVISTKGVARTEKSIRRRRRIVRFLHSLTLGRNDIYSAATFVTVEMTNAKYGIRLNGMRRRACARRRIKIIIKLNTKRLFPRLFILLFVNQPFVV